MRSIYVPYVTHYVVGAANLRHPRKLYCDRSALPVQPFRSRPLERRGWTNNFLGKIELHRFWPGDPNFEGQISFLKDQLRRKFKLFKFWLNCSNSAPHVSTILLNVPTIVLNVQTLA